jgi:hypothetical protein
MSPLAFLGLGIAAPLVAMGVHGLRDRQRRRALRALAAEWGLNYTPDDRFRLAPRVAPRLPTPGAAAVRVVDLLYGIEGARYRYLFVAEYTARTVGWRARRRTVVTFSEPRDPPSGAASDQTIELLFAPDHLPLLEQYRHLRKVIRET